MRNLINLLILCFLVACFGKKPEKTGLEGSTLPSFSLLLPDSTWINTSTIRPGNPTVLFQFSPHCPYCKAQMKDIISKIDKLKDINFYVITLFPYSTMKEFYKEFNIEQYPNIVAGVDTAGFAANYYEATGVPYLAIYNKNKRFTKAFMGRLSVQQILTAAHEHE